MTAVVVVEEKRSGQAVALEGISHTVMPWKPPEAGAIKAVLEDVKKHEAAIAPPPFAISVHKKPGARLVLPEKPASGGLWYGRATQRGHGAHWVMEEVVRLQEQAGLGPVPPAAVRSGPSVLGRCEPSPAVETTVALESRMLGERRGLVPCDGS